MHKDKPEWSAFGTCITGSRWFNRAPVTREVPVVSVEVHWPCPVAPCEGEMIYAGWDWPTGDPGYHHKCNRCGFTAAGTRT